jgi:RNA polymerase sigma factor for flagellar operon FliA
MDSFEAYVDHRIRGAILDELRQHDPLTRDQRAFVRSIAAARHSFSSREGRMPDEHELAAELGISLTRYRQQLDRMHATAIRSDAVPFNEDEDSPAEPANDSPDVIAATRERNDRIAAAINMLPQRLRDVLRLHYHEGRTLREIGLVLGVTESRVSQIHAEAVVRLREVLAEMPL